MSNKNKQRFEFCVGTSNNHRSTVWKIVVNRSDVYIMSKAYGRSAKVSLHESGVCQIALTSEKATELGIPPEERPGQRWYYTLEDNIPNIVFTIEILGFFLADFSEKEELKSNVFIIPPPAEDHVAEILFYKLKLTASVNARLPEGYNYLCGFPLTNGELVVVCYHYPEFTEQNKKVFSNGYRQVIARVNTENITSADLIGYMSTDAVDGNCRLIEIFV